MVDGEPAQEKLRGNPEAFLRYARSLPPDWLQLYGRLLALCDAQGRPPHYAYRLRSRIGAFAGLMGIRDDVHQPRLLAQLTELSGVADYHALPDEIGPGDRLRRALEAAKARYDACPEPLRVVDPLTAVRQLGRLIVQLTGSYVATLDVPACRALPNVAPLAVSSPAFEVISKLVEGTHPRMSGINARFRVVMREVLGRTAQPDRAGLDPSYHHVRLVVMSGIGIVEAGVGLASSLEWAAAIEKTIRARRSKRSRFKCSTTCGRATRARQRVAKAGRKCCGSRTIRASVMLVATNPDAFRTPYRIATELSQQLRQLGDATGMIVPY